MKRSMQQSVLGYGCLIKFDQPWSITHTSSRNPYHQQWLRVSVYDVQWHETTPRRSCGSYFLCFIRLLPDGPDVRHPAAFLFSIGVFNLHFYSHCGLTSPIFLIGGGGGALWNFMFLHYSFKFSGCLFNKLLADLSGQTWITTLDWLSDFDVNCKNWWYIVT